MMSSGPSPPTTPRRTDGMLGWLLSPFLLIADDVVEKYRRDPGPFPGQGLVATGPPGASSQWQGSVRSGSSSPTSQLYRRQLSIRRGARPDKLGLAFERLTDSGLYVVSGVSPLGLSYGKFQVGDVVQAIDGVPLRGKKRAEVKELLHGQPGTSILFDVITVNSSSPLPSPASPPSTKKSATRESRPPENRGAANSRGRPEDKLKKATGKVLISKFLPSGNAQGQVEEGDELFAVDGMAVFGKGTEEIIDLIRGPPGTSVTLVLGMATSQPQKKTPPRGVAAEDYYSPPRAMRRERRDSEGMSVSPDRRIAGSPDRRAGGSPERRMWDSGKRRSNSPDRRVVDATPRSPLRQYRPAESGRPVSPLRETNQALVIQKELEVLQARLRNATQQRAAQGGGDVARRRI